MLELCAYAAWVMCFYFSCLSYHIATSRPGYQVYMWIVCFNICVPFFLLKSNFHLTSSFSIRTIRTRSSIRAWQPACWRTRSRSGRCELHGMLILFVKQTRRLALDYPCIGLLVTPASHVFWSLPSMVSTADIERPFISALLYESTNRDFRWIHSLLPLALPSFLLIRCLRALDPWH